MRKFFHLSLLTLLFSSSVSADPQSSSLEIASTSRKSLYEELQNIFTDVEGSSNLEGRTSEAMSRIEASRKLSHLGKKLDETLITLTETNLAAAKAQIESLREELKLITSGLESGTRKKLEAADLILTQLNEIGSGGNTVFADFSGPRDQSTARGKERGDLFAPHKNQADDLEKSSPLAVTPLSVQTNTVDLGLEKKDARDLFKTRRASIEAPDGYQRSPLAEFVQTNQQEIIHTAQDLALLSQAKGSLKALVDRGLSPRAATELFGTFAKAMGCTALDFENTTQESVKAFFQTAAPFFETYGRPEEAEEEPVPQRPETMTPNILPEEINENPAPPRTRVVLDLAENHAEDPLAGLPGILEIIEDSTVEDLEDTLSANMIEVVKYGGVREGRSVVRTLAGIYNESSPEQQ